MTDPILAVDIGGTKVAAGVVRGGRVVALQTLPTPGEDGPAAILEAAWMVARAAADEHLAAGGRPPVSLGVASAGVIDPSTGTVSSATDALRDWPGTDVARALSARSGLPTRVINDVHAHALGEYVHGRGRGVPGLLLVAVGTGIGGGLIVGGRLVDGAHHVAGHVGHLAVPEAEGIACSCGRSGHVEAVASGTGIARTFHRLSGVALAASEVSALAVAREDPADAVHAREALRLGGRALGRVIGGLLNTLDPGLVVISGSVARAGAIWWDALCDGVAHDAMGIVANTPVVEGELDNAALVGAAAWVQGEGTVNA